MKKLLIIGVAFAFGLNACTFGFGPVPSDPLCDYTYVQAFTEPSGDVLCAIIPGKVMSFVDYIDWFGTRWGRACLGDQLFVDRCVVEAVLELTGGDMDLYPVNVGWEGSVWIESTMPWWSLDFSGVEHISCDWDFDLLATPPFTTPPVVLVDGVDYVISDLEPIDNPYLRVMTVLDGGGKELFTLSWTEKVLTPTPFSVEIPIPTYSGYVTITRIDPDFEGSYIFHVKSEGYYMAPCFTGFMVNFIEPED